MISLFDHPQIYNFLKKNKIVIADIGARGKLIHPWFDIDKNLLLIVGFEPDEKEIERLKKSYPSNLYFPYALWNHNQTLTLHINTNPYTSSIYPPNFNLLNKYDEIHSSPRKTKRIKKVRSKTLDSIVNQYNIHPDFLKIDTQGAEFEILEGAKGAVQNDTFAILIETWTEEVHKKQKLTGDILQLMHKNGFILMDMDVAASWYRKSAKKYNAFGKSQIIGLDLLFFKNHIGKEFFSYEKLIKAALIADIYGYPDVAIELAEYGQQTFNSEKQFFKLLNTEIIHKWNLHNSFIKNLQMKTRQFLYPFFQKSNFFTNRNQTYPPLHE